MVGGVALANGKGEQTPSVGQWWRQRGEDVSFGWFPLQGELCVVEVISFAHLRMSMEALRLAVRFSVWS